MYSKVEYHAKKILFCVRCMAAFNHYPRVNFLLLKIGCALFRVALLHTVHCSSPGDTTKSVIIKILIERPGSIGDIDSPCYN